MFQERERPGSIDPWIDIEQLGSDLASKASGAQFVTEYSYADLKRDVARSPLLIDIDPMHLEAEGECGVGGTDTKIRCGAK